MGRETNYSKYTIEGMHFKDEFSELGLGVTTVLIIDEFGKDFEGNYSCENGVQSDDMENIVRLS